MMELTLIATTASDLVNIDFHKFTEPFDALRASRNL